jgi:diguanylate cyclase (GGDEF)-like protein
MENSRGMCGLARTCCLCRGTLRQSYFITRRRDGGHRLEEGTAMAAGVVVRRRVLIVGRGEPSAVLCTNASRAGWDGRVADSFPQARFLLGGWACDVVAVHDSLAGHDWSDGLAWLAGQVRAPLVLVASFAEDVVLAALRQGLLWLPSDLAQRSPAVLAALLDQAGALGRQRQETDHVRTALANSEAHVERLLGMLWETAPVEGPNGWFTQRHMMERLEEEVDRSRRSGAPLSVVLGELAPQPGRVLGPEQVRELAGWLAGQVGQSKRRCDVAGHYGGHGFLMVLPQTTPRQAVSACHRLRDLLAHPPHGLATVHACFGLASVPEDLPSVPALLRCAEERLARARASPLGGVVAE